VTARRATLDTPFSRESSDTRQPSPVFNGFVLDFTTPYRRGRRATQVSYRNAHVTVEDDLDTEPAARFTGPGMQQSIADQLCRDPLRVEYMPTIT
jgi:hypothetical protein